MSKKQVKRKQSKRKQVKSNFYIWDESGPGVNKLKDDIKSLHRWYKKKQKEKATEDLQRNLGYDNVQIGMKLLLKKKKEVNKK